jgi:hypothetical protein
MLLTHLFVNVTEGDFMLRHSLVVVVANTEPRVIVTEGNWNSLQIVGVE